ncbi:putative nuclease HARBI1 [Sardina pilchardus]|uniref:putative nuclease HARBI1 n=1 Tax=Sardina pilchardus TaxID=27697 RepID=UPI002E167072
METTVIAMVLHQLMELEEEEALRRRAHRRRVMMLAAYWHLANIESLTVYAQINRAMPVLRLFYAEEETRADFRLSRASITGLLVLLQQERHHGWGPVIEVLVFLFWLASGAYYRVVSRAFDMPKTTVHNVVHRVCEAIVAVMPKVIRVPSTADEQQVVSDGFARLAGHEVFRKVMGAIDGCHIRIKAPGQPHAQCYMNRKLFASYQLQAVCDHAGRFIDVFVGFPGSVHDARVLRSSPLYRRAIYPPPGTFLLGDGGYPCLEQPIGLLTPYKNPVRGVDRQRFNGYHSKARAIVERAFGMMKTRWRAIFLHALEVSVSFDPDVIVACTVLHNICLGNDDVLAVDDMDPDEPACGEAETASGMALRDRITDELTL